jgi:Cu/Ag efflux pump CusA
MIGILMLMGIADKNSILLVDYMLELMKQGRSRREAIVEACMVRVPVKPFGVVCFLVFSRRPHQRGKCRGC